MQLNQIQEKKKQLKLKINRGDFILLSRILEVSRQTAQQRYNRDNEKAVLCMENIISEKEKLINKLKRKYAQ